MASKLNRVAGATLTPLTDAKFDKFIREHSRAVIDFWAPWCKYCPEMEPKLSGISSAFRGKVAFAKMNTDKNPRVTRKYRLASLPAVLAFRDGVLKDVLVGACPKRDLAKFVANVFEPD